MRSPELADILEELLLTVALGVGAPEAPAEPNQPGQPGHSADPGGGTRPDDQSPPSDRMRVVFEPVEVTDVPHPPAA